MNRYIIPRNTSESIDWSLIPGIKIESYQQKPEAEVAASAQVCWDDERLSVRLGCTEPFILARFTGEYDSVCRDSCLEMFLCPKAEDGRYFNFEFNPNGASYFGFGYGRHDRMRLHPMDIRELLSVRTCREGNSWEVRFDVPIDVFRLFMPEYTLTEGRKMRGNFYKCGDDIRPFHELMWNPITNGCSDFHQSEFFGDLILG